MRPAFLLLACGALSACAYEKNDSVLSGQQLKAACEVVEHFVLSEFENADRPVHLERRSIQSSYWNLDEDIDQYIDGIRSSQTDPLPRAKLKSMLLGMRAAEKIDPVQTCPNLRHIWTSRSHTAPKLDDLFDYAERNGGNYGILFLGVTLPYVDLERGEAYFSASRIYAPLEGGGVDVMFVRDADGNWQPEGETATWIS